MPSTPLPPLASLSEYPTMGESILFQLNGLIVVFIALSTIWGTMEVIGYFFKRSARRAVKPAPVATETAGTTPAPVETGLPLEVVAAIAAAVHFTFGRNARVRGVIPISSQTVDWAREGRRQIFESHRVR